MLVPGEDEGIVRYYKPKHGDRTSFNSFIWWCAISAVAGFVIWISLLHR